VERRPPLAIAAIAQKLAAVVALVVAWARPSASPIDFTLCSSPVLFIFSFFSPSSLSLHLFRWASGEGAAAPLLLEAP